MSDQLPEMSDQLSLWSDTLTGQVHFLIACTGFISGKSHTSDLYALFTPPFETCTSKCLMLPYHSASVVNTHPPEKSPCPQGMLSSLQKSNNSALS